MLNSDLAELYDVKAIHLREQVKWNIEKVPGHFMFQLTEEEAYNMVSQNAIPSNSSFKVPNWHLKENKSNFAKEIIPKKWAKKWPYLKKL